MDEKRFNEIAEKYSMTSAEVFKRNLTVIMKEQKVSRVELAKKLNMPYTTLCDWCTGRIYPKREKIELLAKALNVQVKDLDGFQLRKDIDDDVSNELATATIAKKIPAGITPRTACAMYPWFETTLTPTLLKHDNYYFGLKITNNDMDPKFIIDDWVVCLQSELIDRDDYYVVRKNDEEAKLRYIINIKDGFTVLTLNTPLGVVTESYKYEDIGKKIEILGRVVSFSKQSHN